jgi:excisionase family DNA binding protein
MSDPIPAHDLPTLNGQHESRPDIAVIHELMDRMRDVQERLLEVPAVAKLADALSASATEGADLTTFWSAFGPEWSEPLTQQELAKCLGLSRNTVGKMLRRGEIPNRKFGSRWQIDLAWAPEAARSRLDER